VLSDASTSYDRLSPGTTPSTRPAARGRAYLWSFCRIGPKENFGSSSTKARKQPVEWPRADEAHRKRRERNRRPWFDSLFSRRGNRTSGYPAAVPDNGDMTTAGHQGRAREDQPHRQQHESCRKPRRVSTPEGQVNAEGGQPKLSPRTRPHERPLRAATLPG